jgi:hypothetical protein
MSDISLMTDVVKANYWVTFEPVCNKRPNLIAFLVNYHGISINCSCL